MIRIDDKRHCCRCTVCQQICPKNCIKMISDYEGFSYPVVDKSICINCNLRCKVCPQINSEDTERTFDVYALSHPDSNILVKSSSEGAFSLLSKWILKNNGIIFGTVFD